jgi:hypothetical protein
VSARRPPAAPLAPALALALALAAGGARAPADGQPPAAGVPDGITARCPAEYGAAWDSVARGVRCRRVVRSWVVTACPDRDFATYVPRPGRDVCEPTPLPGVGLPPGPRRSRPSACASSGYTIVTDRTGPRDRCERTTVQWADTLRPR